ncbi:hypothetical protein [Moorella sp. ACPs]|uniref:hypothetical protein n=1 Tax=Neomoorella carbonis TaxID=3062783 RepID=UPI003872F3F6
MTTIIPRAIIPNSGSWVAMDWRFPRLKNFEGEITDINRKRPAKTYRSIISLLDLDKYATPL